MMMVPRRAYDADNTPFRLHFPGRKYARIFAGMSAILYLRNGSL